MIAALAFGPAQPAPGGRMLRRPAFVPRSTLPVGALCLVANSVRERLGTLLAREFDVELTEATVPDADARRVLFREAHVVRVRGRVADAFVAVRARDARRLVALAFAENERSDREPLSEIETRTLERLLNALVQQSVPLCGAIGGTGPERAERAAAETVSYFEVRISAGAGCAIGFGLTADPAEEVSGHLALDDLLDVSLELRADCEAGAWTLGELASLRGGTTVPVDAAFERLTRIRAGSVVLATGSCGASGERSTVRIDRLGA
jgi:flagellar motor switch/type III secretory pathway protein FliN